MKKPVSTTKMLMEHKYWVSRNTFVFSIQSHVKNHILSFVHECLNSQKASYLQPSFNPNHEEEAGDEHCQAQV
jgi:hypothetical protein